MSLLFQQWVKQKKTKDIYSVYIKEKTKRIPMNEHKRTQNKWHIHTHKPTVKPHMHIQIIRMHFGKDNIEMYMRSVQCWWCFEISSRKKKLKLCSHACKMSIHGARTAHMARRVNRHCVYILLYLLLYWSFLKQEWACGCFPYERVRFVMTATCVYLYWIYVCVWFILWSFLPFIFSLILPSVSLFVHLL